MTIILIALAVVAQSVAIYLMNKQINYLYEILGSEVNFLEKLAAWKTDVDKRIDEADEIARNARSRARETASKLERSVMYEEK